MSTDQPTADGTPGQSPPTQDAPATSPAPTLTLYGVILVVAALMIMSGFSAWVVAHYASDNATNAATILGIVIPAFATIGAAAFGVTVAYKSGSAQGNANGQEQGKADAASAVAPHLAAAQDAVAALKQQLTTHSLSAPGSSDFVFGVHPVDVSSLRAGDRITLSSEPTQVNTEPLETATTSLARAQGAIELLAR